MIILHCQKAILSEKSPIKALSLSLLSVLLTFLMKTLEQKRFLLCRYSRFITQWHGLQLNNLIGKIAILLIYGPI